METITTSVTTGELAELSPSSGVCLTCCLPLPAPGASREELQQSYARLLEAAAARLGRTAGGSAELLAPLQALQSDEQFWLGSGEAVALYSAPGLFRAYRLAHGAAQVVHAGPDGYIRPLLPLLSSGKFLILAANRRRARLIRVDGAQAHEEGLPGYPGSLEDFARARGEDQPGWSEAPGATGMGYSVGEPDPAEDKYFAALAGAIDAALAAEKQPLVLAVDDELGGALRGHLKYRGLVHEFVHGNPDHETAQQLRERAWPLVAGSVTHDRQAAWDELARCQTDGQGLADDLGEILAAAHSGQVAALFLPAAGERWGRYDAEARQTSEAAADEAGTVELLNLAAAQTLRTGGQVYVADQPLPGKMQFAATLRF